MNHAGRLDAPGMAVAGHVSQWATAVATPALMAQGGLAAQKLPNVSEAMQTLTAQAMSVEKLIAALIERLQPVIGCEANRAAQSPQNYVSGACALAEQIGSVEAVMRNSSAMLSDTLSRLQV